jgi:hypothetical protein
MLYPGRDSEGHTGVRGHLWVGLAGSGAHHSHAGDADPRTGGFPQSSIANVVVSRVHG